MLGVKFITESHTFNEKHWGFGEAACHLGVSKTTLKRLTLIELQNGAADIGTLRIAPKKAHALFVYPESALRRIHSRIMGGVRRKLGHRRGSLSGRHRRCRYRRQPGGRVHAVADPLLSS